ncbi:helix-turn-helix domain-containing protein [Rossellomorea marisflavi]|uniref:helix-turn-helix domain-containing protein n=1 Tax=Rossellomorea marisflavi TaxID=189381 RepID=UPI00345AE91C
MSIGNKIKHLRNYFNVSQKDLSRGICTQSYISQVERNEKNISADILYYISERLGVGIYYFFDNPTDSNLGNDYISVTLEEIRKGVVNRDYNSVYDIVRLEKRNPLFSSESNKQFLLWHEAICEFELFRNFERATFLLDESLQLNKTTFNCFSERELDILLTQAIILEEEKTGSGLGTYSEILLSFSNLLAWKDYNLPSKIYYNYARALTQNGDYYKSIEVCRQGLTFSRKNRNLYLLGELYYQLGLCSFKLEKFVAAKDQFQQALNAFTLTGEVDLQVITSQKLQLLDKI